MNLILTVSKSPPGGAPAGTSCTVDESGTTIGRHEKNTWVLPSVEGDGLSRFHCRIAFEGGRFSVIDTKCAYGVFLNDVRVKTEGKALLNDGDRLRLGEYELLVEVEAPELPAEPEPFKTPEPEWDPPEPVPPSEPPIVGLGQGSPETDVVQVTPSGRPAAAIPDDWWKHPAGLSPERPTRQPVSRPTPSVDGFAAFLAGIALQGAVQPTMDQSATLRAVGETYRVAVEGIWEILKSRDQVKNEFRIERTRVAVAENNPLKKTHTPEEALSMMIAGNRSGFMPPAAAMTEALRDIKDHEMALIAAIQVALTRLLEQIDPKTLEARLEKRWLLDDLVPSGRKARIWEIYELKHAEIARELEEDFQGAFGRAFAQAYEQYVRQR